MLKIVASKPPTMLTSKPPSENARFVEAVTRNNFSGNLQRPNKIKGAHKKHIKNMLIVGNSHKLASVSIISVA